MKTFTSSGFTLLEMLVVLAVLGLLVALGLSPYRYFVNTAKVNQAAEQFARDVENQRFNVKKTNTARTITINTSTNSYTLGTSTTTLPSGTKIALGTNATSTITFYPPFGTTISPVGVASPNIRSYTISLSSNSSYSRTVNVVGLIGKVVVK
ncbi:prepilin-type N-terminal cleavage/methylation domain-containing protein [Deinococcus roseus]|uniref:Prepilin-type N-terminal cleavage/methylation domain-containing protein n=1 Tax=Deinococcus roseus TaxID=392414 RepID=A0ABQ2CZE3_9DEIO|nr:prepilin-type N-terminal cleavage/methylation domain-containing protein [Deinococcus roseus]GGJ35748.1 hypothetical protein GCM10008938_22340 [Deinococcus roseus]